MPPRLRGSRSQGCAVALLALSFALALGAARGEPAAGTVTGDPVIAAAGDIACDPGSASFNGGAGTVSQCHQMATSNLLLGGDLAAVLTLGDNQYDCGAASAFLQSYDPSWGRVKSLTRPAPGNHEYQTSPGTDCDTTGAAGGYYGYFGPAAGDPAKGYYSFDIGAWHLISLNSNCAKVGGCGWGSPQNSWLRQDLAASSARCTLAYWHHPLFASGNYRPGIGSARPLFQALYDHNADIVLNGHDHIYERFGLQDAAGASDPVRGIRQFIVGTGGKVHYAQGTPIANSEALNSTTYGVLRLTLHPEGYEWQFVPEAGATYTDSGTDACRPVSDDSSPPSIPQDLTASAQSGREVGLSWSPSTDNVGVLAYDVYRNGTLLAGTASTTYTDDTVVPSTSYEYQVRARDAASNASALGPVTAVTTPADPDTLSFVAEADARVEEANPSTNYGTSSLRADGGALDPEIESYLRFNVSGLGGPVESAKLRLYAFSATFNGPAVYGAATNWSENAITWTNRPARTSDAVADVGLIASDTWVEYDVSSLVGGEGEYAFELATPSTDAVDFNSREFAIRPPELLVTYRPAPYPRPIGAAKARFALVPAIEPCTEPSTSHGSPLQRGACAPVVPSSARLTVPADDTSRASGFIVLKVVCTDQDVPPCPAPGNQAEVMLTINAADVRERPALTDYQGELEAVLSVRITDRDSGLAGGENATVSDLSLSFPFACQATADPATGGSCAVTTSVNAVLPGVVKENERALWELGQVKVRDGGADGLAETATDNTDFLRQGLFVP